MPANHSSHAAPVFPSVSQFQRESAGHCVRNTLHTLVKVLASHTTAGEGDAGSISPAAFLTAAEELLQQHFNSEDNWSTLEKAWRQKLKSGKNLSPWQFITCSAVLVLTDCFHQHSTAASRRNVTPEQLLTSTSTLATSGHAAEINRHWLEAAINTLLCNPPELQQFIADRRPFDWLNVTVAFRLFHRKYSPDLADNDHFNSCFNFLADRCITHEAWPKLVRAYREAVFLGSSADFDSFFRTRIELLTLDWQRSNTGQLHAIVAQHVEDIASAAIDSEDPIHESADTDNSAIASLLGRCPSPESCCCLLLRLWPRLSLLMQQQYWPHVVTGAAAIHAKRKKTKQPNPQQPVSETELRQRLSKPLEERLAAANDCDERFRELESTIALLQAHEHAADVRKRQAVGRRLAAAVSHQLQRFPAASAARVAELRSQTREDVLSTCRAECQTAVKKGSIDRIKQDFDPGQIYSQQQAGRPTVVNHELWNRRDFCIHCHLQKYYRRRRLNKSADTQKYRDAGCLSDPEIATVLQCPRGTVESHLNHVREWTSTQPEAAVRRDTSSQLEHEASDESRLNEWVCGQLEPPHC
jgi:DNA-directed RNA polymerase specialized sigma24 family protein